MATTPDSAASHVGFRIVMTPAQATAATTSTPVKTGEGDEGERIVPNRH
jgi:hypothetical protein